MKYKYLKIEEDVISFTDKKELYNPEKIFNDIDLSLVPNKVCFIVIVYDEVNEYNCFIYKNYLDAFNKHIKLYNDNYEQQYYSSKVIRSIYKPELKIDCSDMFYKTSNVIAHFNINKDVDGGLNDFFNIDASYKNKKDIQNLLKCNKKVKQFNL